MAAQSFVENVPVRERHHWNFVSQKLEWLTFASVFRY